jgi:uncharacterized membrane protein YphA (DoxX/SURF4 family)
MLGYGAVHGGVNLAIVQRLFSMFPAGLPGFALLLLRGSAAIALVLEEYGHRNAVFGWMQGATLLIAAALVVGYLTPIAAVAGLVFHGLIWLAAGIDSASMAVILSLDAMALALLGPGAYSVDARRFGRRLVELPPA